MSAAPSTAAPSSDAGGESPEEDSLGDIICVRCESGGDEDNLIECDADCGRWWHLGCCEPKLETVPDDWACPDCADPREYGVVTVGDVVFAKFEHYPWWPARVLALDGDACAVSEAVPRRGTLTGRDVRVLFVGRGVAAEVDSLRVVPFDLGLKTLRSWRAARRGAFNLDAGCTREAFAAAVAEGLELAARRDAVRTGSTADDERAAMTTAAGLAPGGALVLGRDDESSGDEDAVGGRPFATATGGAPPPSPREAAAAGAGGGSPAPRRRRTTKLNRPSTAPPATATGEHTSVRDSHLWYAAMLECGVAPADALRVVVARLGVSEAFAATLVRGSVRGSQGRKSRARGGDDGGAKRDRGDRGDRDEDGSYFRDFAITRPTKRQMALVEKKKP